VCHLLKVFFSERDVVGEDVVYEFAKEGAVVH
jgi:hypothetical protein